MPACLIPNERTHEKSAEMEGEREGRNMPSSGTGVGCRRCRAPSGPFLKCVFHMAMVDSGVPVFMLAACSKECGEKKASVEGDKGKKEQVRTSHLGEGGREGRKGHLPA